jgi:hypothetical protein
MKIQIEMEPELIDSVVKSQLLWHNNFVKEELTVLKKKKKLEKYQTEDKEYFEKLLPALKIVSDYFGANK